MLLEHPDCPVGLTACPVNGDGFECLNTDTELEVRSTSLDHDQH